MNIARSGVIIEVTKTIRGSHRGFVPVPLDNDERYYEYVRKAGSTREQFNNIPWKFRQTTTTGATA